MKKELKLKAKELALQSYNTDLFMDETTDGGEIYLASHPELFGCMAQGKDIKEVLQNLEDATIEYIESLLEDQLPVPQPEIMKIGTGGPENAPIVQWDFKSAGGNFFNDLCEAVQPANRRSLGSITPISDPVG
jgi:predicted RNase H-like HicB family nuclease